MTDREILIKKISSYQFTIHDLRLYLDTHPGDEKTLMKIRELEDKYVPLRAKYEEMYGPLTVNENKTNRWCWIKSPWPWENEEVK